VRWPALILNLLVIAATPVHGGHHVIDIAGGAVVAVLAITVADAIVRRYAKDAERQGDLTLPDTLSTVAQ